MTDLTRLEAAAAQLESLPDDGEAADYVGRLDRVIRTLQGHRRTIIDELPGPVSGRDYRIVEARSADRSYNTRLLRQDFFEEGYTFDDLIDAGVLRLTWSWTKLHDLAVAADITLRSAGHEISEDEAVHVGEVWKSAYRVEGVK